MIGWAEHFATWGFKCCSQFVPLKHPRHQSCEMVRHGRKLLHSVAILRDSHLEAYLQSWRTTSIQRVLGLDATDGGFNDSSLPAIDRYSRGPCMRTKFLQFKQQWGHTLSIRTKQHHHSGDRG